MRKASGECFATIETRKLSIFLISYGNNELTSPKTKAGRCRSRVASAEKDRE
jgi:hypothetical protein